MHSPHSPEFTDNPTFYTPGGYGQEYRTDGVSAVDWLGNRFKLGDLVMYCIGAGRGQMMALGRVQRIRAHKQSPYWDAEARKQVKDGWRWEVEVQVLTERTSGRWGNEARTKPAWVNPMNITLFVDPAADRRELAERFANQEQNRLGAIDELADLL